MSGYLEEALRLIAEQQKETKEGSAAWMVGEQLKDICRAEPASAELIAQDLTVKEMGIREAEKKIKAFADKNRVGNFACVTPLRAEKILREFYGLTERGEAQQPATATRPVRKVLDLTDFM